MKVIAYRAKSAEIALGIGAFLFTMLILYTVSARPDGWRLYAILMAVCSAVFIISFFIEFRKPVCLIKSSDDILWIYRRGRWNQVNIADVRSVEHRRTKSGSFILSSGTLKIFTVDSSYTLSNVKDVEEVSFFLRQKAGV